MQLILIYWFLFSLCALAMTYVLFQFTDGDDDDLQPPQA
jgi:hypothetical protein